MELKEKNVSNFNLFDILIFLYNKKIQIFIITFIGIIGSIIMSYMIPAKFKSSVIIYPATGVSFSKTVLNDITNNDLLQFGEEEETEQMLQILSSTNFTEKIIEKFDLYSHYGIDKNGSLSQTAILNEISGNISYDKTQYDAIQIKVFDKDPKKSSEIANGIINLLDSTMFQIFVAQTQATYNYLQTQYDESLNTINFYEDSLNYYRKLGVFDYNLDVERYTEAMAKGYANNTISNNGKIFFEEKFAILAEQGGNYNTIKDLISIEKTKLTQIRERIIEVKANLNTDLKHSFVVQNSLVADKKAKPVRWLIVTLSTIGTFSFAIFALLLIEFLKIFRKKLNEQNIK